MVVKTNHRGTPAPVLRLACLVKAGGPLGGGSLSPGPGERLKLRGLWPPQPQATSLSSGDEGRTPLQALAQSRAVSG